MPRFFVLIFGFIALQSSVYVIADDGSPTTDQPQIDWLEALPVEQVREDLEVMYQGLQNGHANLYAQRSPAEYFRFYESMRDAITRPMSRRDVQIAFARFAAFGKVAHANVGFPNDAFEQFRNQGGRTFPFYLRIVDGVVFVSENLSGHTDIQTGDVVTALNGRPMSEWLDRVADHISADSPYIAHSLLEFTFARDLWAVLGEVDTFDLDLERNGDAFRVEVKATRRDQQRAAAVDLTETFSLSGNERKFQMLDERLGYLRPGPFYNVENPSELWDNTAFVAFINQAFEQLLSQQAESLIIDLRQNPGGDNSFSDPMLAWIADEPFRFCSLFLIRSSDEAAASNAKRLDASGNLSGVSAQFAKEYDRVPRGHLFPFDIPFAEPRKGERFDGKVYVLINRHSYSNAVNVAAMVQDYGMGTIVGEKTSDLATTYGAMEQFSLPNTGISVSFPKAHIVRPSGDTQPDGVTPDWAIPSPVTSTQTDTVLDQLIERLQSN
ncbi:MAG: S41 family peptidase [Pseudomonadota bacterium]